ncbi:hypothetical protein BDV97DRAFT_396124 [Delphinella strobiligena]|nr:hypothetical protein BDV97DRAFT_396124 [Delphinella strobiligena]
MEQSPYMLLDLYKSQSRMPLGHRICLAHALAVALENFHRVGWVHKEIRSSNIFFIPGDQSTVIPGSARTPSALAGSINLSTPWLFGFEYARSEDAGTKLEEDHNLTNNLYRHPFRWGRPRAKFTKAHDVYSLGIVLFEIANWRDIASLMKISENEHLSPQTIRKQME